MLKLSQPYNNVLHLQRGAAAVEFAIIAMLLFTLLFGILEFGRLFYVFNSVQEVTRRAAREAVVRWTDTASQNEAKNLALFGGNSLPAGAEIAAANICIEYLTASYLAPAPTPNSAAENIAACLSGPTGCIAYVRVSIIGVPGPSCGEPNTNKAYYTPMINLFPYFNIPIPASTVTMPAESMGYAVN